MGRKDDPRAFGCDMCVCNEEEELSNTLQTKANSLNSTNPVLHQAETAEDNAVTIHDGTRWIVRRLTPLECERLQGFPDNWTQIPWKGKPAEECPDGVRYKAIGNSMAVPTMLWLGSRLQEVEERYGADNRQATQDA